MDAVDGFESFELERSAEGSEFNSKDEGRRSRTGENEAGGEERKSKAVGAEDTVPVEPVVVTAVKRGEV